MCGGWNAIARAAGISHVSAANDVQTFHQVVVTALDADRSCRVRDRDLLSGTGEPVTAIAYRWGFRNMSFFSRLFHQQYGVAARDLQTAARARARPQM